MIVCFIKPYRKYLKNIDVCPNMEISKSPIMFFQAPLVLPKVEGVDISITREAVGKVGFRMCEAWKPPMRQGSVSNSAGGIKKVWWILEQPMSSVMEWHPLFQAVIKLLGMRKMLVSMSKYGGPTDKKTYLYSRDSFVPSNKFVSSKAGER